LEKSYLNYHRICLKLKQSMKKENLTILQTEKYIRLNQNLLMGTQKTVNLK
jgi:hypothetical protein